MLLRQELLSRIPVLVHLLRQKVASPFQALSFSISNSVFFNLIFDAKSFSKAASFSAFLARLSEEASESWSLFCFHVQQFVEKLLQQTGKTWWQLVLHRLWISRFDSVDPSCLFLRECMVTNLRLMFVTNSVVGLRNLQTIRDHEEYLLVSAEESKESRQSSIAVDKWSWVCLIYRCFWLAPGPPEFLLRVVFGSY